MIQMPINVLEMQLRLVNAKLASLEPHVKEGRKKLTNIGRQMDKKANEIKRMQQEPTTNNKSKRLLRQLVAVLVEEFQLLVDRAVFIKTSVDHNEAILVRHKARRRELEMQIDKVKNPQPTMAVYANYKTRAAQEQIDRVLRGAVEGAKRRRDKTSQRARSMADMQSRPDAWQGPHIGNGKNNRSSKK